ncbi:MAG: NUDIX hydrolase [Nitrososphaeraceae archaeon]
MTKIKLLNSNQVYSGKISVRMDEFILEGKTIHKEIVEHSHSVGIIPILENNNILLITQYRHATGKVLLEIPAGKIEKGETKEKAAKRELLEETGYSGKFTLLTQWYLAPGYDTEMMYIFLVTNLKKASEKKCPDADENIRLKKYSFKTAIKKCMTAEIIDCKTIAALFLYKEYLGIFNKIRKNKL